MTHTPQTLSLLPETFMICRLSSDAPIPDWVLGGSFCSITRTLDELSIICPQGAVPEGCKSDIGWRCFKIEGPFDLASTGILTSVAVPLSDAGFSVFAVATYDTDYLLVQEQEIARAVQVLSQAGHRVLSRIAT